MTIGLKPAFRSYLYLTLRQDKRMKCGSTREVVSVREVVHPAAREIIDGSARGASRGTHLCDGGPRGGLPCDQEDGGDAEVAGGPRVGWRPLPPSRWGTAHEDVRVRTVGEGRQTLRNVGANIGMVYAAERDPSGGVDDRRASGVR